MWGTVYLESEEQGDLEIYFCSVYFLTGFVVGIKNMFDLQAFKIFHLISYLLCNYKI